MAGNVGLGLRGRVCVVTGAAGGIGSEIALTLARAGGRIAGLDIDRLGVSRAMATLREQGYTAIDVDCDVTSTQSVAAAAETVAAELGPSGVLVNNAAALYADALLDIDVDRWQRVMDVNLNGYLRCAQAFGRQMADAGIAGSMIHIGSVSGSLPQPYSGAYSVSKAAVRMLSNLLAIELGEYGIRSNLVSPALLRTQLTEGMYADPAVLAQREAAVPLGRIGTVADVADAVLFLAGDSASYLSGQELAVDGGLAQSWLRTIPRPGFEKSSSSGTRRQDQESGSDC
ncbi:SDR family NAD(P)-dependent oxidoreductase [Rhodococcus jostii]|uniref:NAD(P)-dependent dehydrogenase, short-chain alcohol dehydrogenase family n=1 Tax=Rhodococcus jostii TaxID=132919 RepID=A0A1H4IWW9_RHOJO|nr:SDR family oxidoreductase [Rhodococcus jostii]KXF53735.1 hypothetical protein AXA44_43445 [Rhodococcus sp. SC4]SEB38584.1 NAD(P)-dependent dehydrogenase, short-chain alcohol dehydrogenase family [Rhodococcus jostii]